MASGVVPHHLLHQKVLPAIEKDKEILHHLLHQKVLPTTEKDKERTHELNHLHHDHGHQDCLQVRMKYMMFISAIAKAYKVAVICIASSKACFIVHP